ncbi:urea carboxylase-associated family protein [Actinophytocola xanthii]|uniref:DUF1989 domain-containing protein n=1 Tax=Actinophytocola xanthii TaxID=1912961 RepID=A0A1Q8CPE0_9PSEU|nr:urea carboxylase-associated family protein [Actinophytocola xanthii]OLF16216.1 hypothetical protein BU204_17740 [Actinophytocola xanthii]
MNPGELVPAMSGRAWRVPPRSLVEVIDVEGSQTGDVFAVPTDDLEDGLSNGRTFDYGESIRLTTGSVLYSRRSRPLLTIVEDEVGTHDFLWAPCSQEMYEIGYGVTEPHPNCLDNLTASLGGFGVPAATVTIAFNVFMNVAVGQDGGLAILPPATAAGQSVTFRTERELLVAVTACAATTANGGAAKPLRVRITEGAGSPTQGRA